MKISFQWHLALLSLSPLILPFITFSVFDYSYRDYVQSWYGQLSRDEGQLHQMLSEDFWEVIKQLRGHLADIDVVDLVCNNTVKSVHAHFCDLKTANTRYGVCFLPYGVEPMSDGKGEKKLSTRK